MKRAPAIIYEQDYVARKIRSLLQYGADKVIWIRPQLGRILAVIPGRGQLLTIVFTDVFTIDDFSLNVQPLSDQDGIAY